MSSANKNNYKVKLSRKASTYLSRINSPFDQRIINALRLLAINPKNDSQDIIPLEGRAGEYRLRVGKYRIIFTIDDSDKTINVATILPRGDVYK